MDGWVDGYMKGFASYQLVLTYLLP